MSRRGAGIVLLAAAMFVAAPAHGAPGVSPADRFEPRVGDDVPASATDLRSGSTHNAPMVLADPTEPGFVVLVHRQDSLVAGCGIQVSGDGGTSWERGALPALPAGVDRCDSPNIALDRHGRLYFLYSGLDHSGTVAGLYLATSTDRGHSFSASRRVLGPGVSQVRLVIDPTLGANGRLYVAWLQTSPGSGQGGLGADDNPILVAFSDDRGQLFSPPVRVHGQAAARIVAPEVAVGRDHALHVVYYDLRDDIVDYEGQPGPRWPGRWSVLLATSFDRGAHFEPAVVVDDNVVPAGRVPLIYAVPPPSIGASDSGDVYVAWSDARNDDPDVFLARSSTDGRSFLPLLRVNDDPLGNGKDQSLPVLGVGPSGRLDVAYLDRRADPADLRNDVLFVSSPDGGSPLGMSVRLTSESSDSRIGKHSPFAAAGTGAAVGERLGLYAGKDRSVVAWPDMRNAAAGSAQQDIFTSKVETGGAAHAGSQGRPRHMLPIWVLAGAGLPAGFLVVLASRRLRSHRRDAPQGRPG